MLDMISKDILFLIFLGEYGYMHNIMVAFNDEVKFSYYILGELFIFLIKILYI